MDLSVRPTVVVEVVGIVVRVDSEGLVGRQLVQIEQLAGEARRTLVNTVNIGRRRVCIRILLTCKYKIGINLIEHGIVVRCRDLLRVDVVHIKVADAGGQASKRQGHECGRNYIFNDTFHNDVCFKLLEIEVHTKDDLERTRIHVTVETALHLWVNALIVCDGEHVLHGSIDTSANAIVASAFEEIVERVAQGDVVHLEERGVLNEHIGESLIAGVVEAEAERIRQAVAQITQTID